MPEPAERPRRSCCPVACTLDLLGDRWTLLVVRDLFRGVDRYSAFARSPEGIATNILADRLDDLVANGIAERFVPTGQKRARYRLTDAGRELEPLLRAVADWGLKHIPGTEARQAPQPN
ncbi:MAG: helix-turn-helix transcriptional regulator [Phycisphaerales bacterium]|nr:helix-turn-helix transcriptional regulator [Phycisphaerales bacterium]